ncbi:phage tail assembly chaperone [Chromobacterium piscinae]|uniref:phage tail assembly chaperone n=1 Tax=Chromobacterium piscinae TaxID=686831 RepID=UPI003F822F6C
MMFALWIDADQRFAFSETDNGGMEIADSAYLTLIAGHREGQQISRDDAGAPVLQAFPPPSSTVQAEAARIDRDARLVATQWLIERQVDQSAAGDATTLTHEQYMTLLHYRQALRDVPAQCGFPTDINWPEVPDFVKDTVF